ncbi:DUF4956 domain-containing protein, partial [Turicibacter sanguinis]|nr:DUF4956 domain-containing protein [Turicibacter sanguinis]
FTHRKETTQQSFVITLVMLPIVISVIILLIGNNVARAFSLAGAFSIIRFRSAPGDAKDMSYIFFTLAVGLACGMGYIGYAALITVVLCLLMMLLSVFQFGRSKTTQLQLKITVPEHLNYQDLFDEVLENYTTSYRLERVRTREFGALFEVSYRIQLKDVSKQKEFLDLIRCRNGNLNVSLILCDFGTDSY